MNNNSIIIEVSDIQEEVVRNKFKGIDKLKITYTDKDIFNKEEN